jgi:hypothetical protein
VFCLDRMGMVFRRQCFVVMDRAAYYRNQAKHARQLAEATWQPDFQDMLRRLAKDYNKTAEDIETGAIEIPDTELMYGCSPPSRARHYADEQGAMDTPLQPSRGDRQPNRPPKPE